MSFSMNRPRTRSVWGIVAIGLIAWDASAMAQSSFDPYRPESSSYDSSSYPTQPNNLALPNAAREANEYANNPRGPGSSRFNSFERYLNEGVDSEALSAPRRGPSAGVPYYNAYRRYDREYQRDYVPNRVADRAFSSDTARRERLYQAALRERDPVKRSKILRDYHQAVRTRPTPARSADPTRPATSPRVDRAEALYGEALSGTVAPSAPGRSSEAMLDPMSPTTPYQNGLGGTRGILDRDRRAGELRRRPPLPLELDDRRPPVVAPNREPAPADVPAPTVRPR